MTKRARFNESFLVNNAEIWGAKSVSVHVKTTFSPGYGRLRPHESLQAHSAMLRAGSAKQSNTGKTAGLLRPKGLEIT
jgi:hypothetical protein